MVSGRVFAHPHQRENARGILSTAYVKDPDDPAWKDDAGVKGWREFMSKYVPEADQHDTNYVNSYNSAMALEAVLKATGVGLSGLVDVEVALGSGGSAQVTPGRGDPWQVRMLEPAPRYIAAVAARTLPAHVAPERLA